MLSRDYMFDMESDERRRLLRYAAILTRIPGAFSNRFTQALVHVSTVRLSALFVEEAPRLRLHD